MQTFIPPRELAVLEYLQKVGVSPPPRAQMWSVGSGEARPAFQAVFILEITLENVPMAPRGLGGARAADDE